MLLHIVVTCWITATTALQQQPRSSTCLLSSERLLLASGHINRRLLIESAAAAAVVAVTSAVAPASAAQPSDERKVTSRAYMEVRIAEALNEANGYSSSGALRKRVVFGLYGTAAPLAVQRFLSYIRPAEAADSTGADGDEVEGLGPSYAASLFTKLVPGERVEGGRISGLLKVALAGSEQLQFNGKVLPASLILEENRIKHDRRGLLSRYKLEPGPQFSITLSAAPQLDGTHEVSPS